MNSKAKKTALFGLMIALAFVFSYLETLIPLNIGVAGVKLGLANLVVVTALYTMPRRDAFFIAIIRIILVGITFAGVSTLIYSLAGGLLSFAVMCLLQKASASPSSESPSLAELRITSVKFLQRASLCKYQE